MICDQGHFTFTEVQSLVCLQNYLLGCVLVVCGGLKVNQPANHTGVQFVHVYIGREVALDKPRNI